MCDFICAVNYVLKVLNVKVGVVDIMNYVLKVLKCDS